jgi:glycosyltransferase involved in cell wall biosynthesis
MKAIFIGSDPSLYNPESSAYARMKEYAAAIGTLRIIMRSDEADSVHEDGALTIEGVRAGRLESMRVLAARAKERIGTDGVEVVSAQDPFEHGWAAMKAVEGTNARLHIQVHTDFLSPWFVRGGIARSPQVPVPVKNRVRQVIAGRVLPKAHGIRVVSVRIKDSLVKKYGTKIVEPTVLPIAVGTVLPGPVELPTHNFPFVLATVGRLEPEKRIEDIIEALANVTERFPAIGLMIIGEGSEKARLMTLVVEKGLTGKVIFTGDRPDAWGLMRSAQGYIQASAYEGYSRTLVEAALARVPIITSDVGIVGEVFAGYEDVLATPPGDPTNLAYHMIALLEDRPGNELRIRSAEAKALAHTKQYENLPQLIAADLARLVSTPEIKEEGPTTASAVSPMG